MSLVALALCVLSGCSTALAGEARPDLVIGVAQRTDEGLAVTPLVLLDPAPLYKTSEYDDVESGTRLVAVQFKVTNTGERDQLIGPVGTVSFHTGDGKTLDDSLHETAAGPMFDQLRLGPEQTMVGYVTAEIPEGTTVDEVGFSYGYEPHAQTLTWRTAGQAVRAVPEPPAREDDKATVHRMGEAVKISGQTGEGTVTLEVAPGRLVDPAEATDQVRPGPEHRLVGVEFTVSNTGDQPYDDIDNDADLRIFALHDKADEFVESHVYGASEVHGMPLAPGADDTWTVLFEVPADFEVDRISFSPSYGSRVATIWQAN
ncbi:DUF4352 domain-containing protein [Actinophytocola sp.]|uniref:DUF4352 domain-containing protein n=1 Tax=Actinophytocola sp. TaxID=1872138 RepID=UPI00389A75C1